MLRKQSQACTGVCKQKGREYKCIHVYLSCFMLLSSKPKPSVPTNIKQIPSNQARLSTVIFNMHIQKIKFKSINCLCGQDQKEITTKVNGNPLDEPKNLIHLIDSVAQLHFISRSQKGKYKLLYSSSEHHMFSNNIIVYSSSEMIHGFSKKEIQCS